MILSLKTPPAELPVTADELNQWLKIDDLSVAEEGLIEALNYACTEIIEKLVRRVCIEQTWEYKIKCFSESIEIPLPPLISVESIKYYDSQGTLRTLSTSVYNVLKTLTNGYITRMCPYTWPTHQYRDDAIIIEFKAGYGAKEDVPETLKTGIKSLVAHYFENRNPGDIKAEEIPEFINNIIRPYKVLNV